MYSRGPEVAYVVLGSDKMRLRAFVWLDFGRAVGLGFAIAVLLGAGVWSVRHFFTPRFWTPQARLAFDAERTALNEAVAQDPPSHLITMWQMTFFNYYGSQIDAAAWEPLSVENWLPPNDQAVTYLFTREAGLLRPEYERLFPGRVQPIDQGFLVRLEPRDWSWLRQHGWSYEYRCGAVQRRKLVPFLFGLALRIGRVSCSEPATHTWRAHWHGDATDMTLEFTGKASVEAPGVTLERDGWEAGLPFRMPADVDVTITLSTPEWARAKLYENSPAGKRAPAWELFTPINVDGEAAGKPQ